MDELRLLPDDAMEDYRKLLVESSKPLIDNNMLTEELARNIAIEAFKRTLIKHNLYEKWYHKAAQ